MPPIISVSNLSKTYASGFEALKRVSLDIRRGEIFGLLGPNGAGKTTLINIICGIVTPSAGAVAVGGHDILRDYRAARAMIGLVPQELTSHAFESVWATVSFSRGLFGKPGKKVLTLQLHEVLAAIPAGLAAHRLSLAANGRELVYTYDTQRERTGITSLLDDLNQAGIGFKDLQTTQSSLEDIFVDLVRQK